MSNNFVRRGMRFAVSPADVQQLCHAPGRDSFFVPRGPALQGSCSRAENSAAAGRYQMDADQCTISMGAASQPILAAAFAPVWLSNIVIHSQAEGGTQTAAISVSDGLLYMENSAVLAVDKASIQAIALRESRAFITGAHRFQMCYAA